MSNPVVVYTDPPWAKGPDGQTDPARADIEREVFGDAIELKIASTREGRFPSTGQAVADLVRGADALAIYRLKITAEILDAAGPGLKVVARQGVGFDNLRPDLLATRGILGFNVPDYCVDEVAAHTMALALALERGLIAQHQTLTGGRFDIYHGGTPRRLRRCTAGIVGFGRIGRAVATRLKSFYGRVQACDPYVEGDLMEAYGVDRAGFHELLHSSDIVFLHCSLNEETRELLDAGAFSRLRPGAFFVNAARGAIVNSEALRDALASGRLGGAAIDVFSPEDPHEDPYYREVLGMANTVVTSHRAFLSREAEASQRRRVAAGIRRALETGEPPAVGNLTPGVGLREASAATV